MQREDIDVIDVVTRAGDQHDNSHEVLTFEALEAGKHVLVEKPVCHDYKDVIRAQQLADSKNLKDQSRFDVPICPCGTIYVRSRAQRVHWRSLHLQRV